MPLQKQSVQFNFGKGLDTKTDPNQVSLGNFLTLTNSVFTTAGRLTKRNGFGKITTLPNADQTTLTTFNGNLIATGSSLYAFSQDTDTWLNQGTIQPVSMSAQALVRSSSNQSNPDAAIASNGLVCLVYNDTGGAYYQVSDSVTGQPVINKTLLPNSSTDARVLLLGQYFIVIFLSTVTGTPELRYIAIPTSNPVPRAVATISSTVRSNPTGYDVYVTNNVLYVAWSENSSNILITGMNTSLVLASPTTVSGHTADRMSLTADTSGARPVIWLTFWDSGSMNAYSMTFSSNLTQMLAPTMILSGVSLNTLTSSANNGVNTVFYETNNTYMSPYPTANVKTDFVSSITITSTGTVGSPTVLLRSVGLASKPFTINGTTYFWVTYGEMNQPTYFLTTSTGDIIARLAYSNGGGYETTQVLPTVSTDGTNWYYPYLFKDFLATVNKGTNLQTGTPTNAIYTQTGLNLLTFTINSSGQYSLEIANQLNLTGGMMWSYDGVKPVENNFQVWPENVAFTSSNSGGQLDPETYFYVFTYEWTNNQGNLERSSTSIPLEVDLSMSNVVTFTATFAANSDSLTVSSTSGLSVGQVITDLTNETAFPPGTYITAIGGTVTVSQPANVASQTGGDSVRVYSGVYTTATFSANSTSITVASASGLAVGQLLQDNNQLLQAGTLITHIAGTTITISQPTTGAGTSAVVYTTSTLSNTLYVPTLRLTYKTNVRIVGYRWSANQQTYYQFTSLTSPTLNDPTVDYVTITDTLNDNSILGNVILYTTGGVVEDIAAPPCAAIAAFKSRVMLLDAEDRNLIWFSKQVIEAVPVEMSDLFTIFIAPTIGAQGSTGPVTAISAMDDKFIVFKRDAIYYITGDGPDNTGANNDFSDPIFITSSVGCTNQSSIVLMKEGIMFQSDKGIWLLGRDLSTSYIGAAVEGFNQYTVKSATNIPGTTQVRFVLSNNVILMYDYFYQQWGTFNTIQATSATLYQNLHTYLNQFGEVFQETPGSYIDGSSPVLMSFTTSWFSLAGLRGFERFYFGFLLGTYITPFKLAMSLSYDYFQAPQQTIMITPDNNTPNWGDEAVWGGDGPWGGPGNTFQARFFPAKQKCQTFQISMQEIYDASLGVPAGQGLSLSGMNIVIGAKKSYSTQKASRSFG